MSFSFLGLQQRRRAAKRSAERKEKEGKKGVFGGRGRGYVARVELDSRRALIDDASMRSLLPSFSLLSRRRLYKTSTPTYRIYTGNLQNCEAQARREGRRQGEHRKRLTFLVCCCGAIASTKTQALKASAAQTASPAAARLHVEKRMATPLPQRVAGREPGLLSFAQPRAGETGSACVCLQIDFEKREWRTPCRSLFLLVLLLLLLLQPLLLR